MKIISVENVSYRYPNGTEALKDISFSLMYNQKVAVIGHNGSGKSTLLLLLSALQLPTSGKITIFDIPLTNSNKSTIRKNVGMLFSQVEYQFIMPDLLNDVMLSIKEGSKEDKKLQAQMWLEKVQLGDSIFHNPLALSSGQMKRAALAAVLAKKPKILLLDEPLANLDKPSADAVLNILKGISVPVIFSTHSAYAVQQLANRIIVLEKGRIVCNDIFNKRILAKYKNTILL
ncbi:MAG: energy-coupling factor ABC transporter ATP-binding protein [Spirochaetes bacterium]|nr:energy-coupling factor ABC transporter ATP-binding protein [Spirochaetota bacterium]